MATSKQLGSAAARAAALMVLSLMPYSFLAAQSTPYGPEVTFKTQSIFPPSAVYVGPDDSIVVLVRNPSVLVTITLNFRLLTPQGEVMTNTQDFTGQSLGNAANIFSIPPSEGFLLSAEVTGPTISRGQCFVRVFLARGQAPAPITLDHMLLQGYVSNDDNLGYPQSPTESSLDGRGWSRAVNVGAPGIGAEWTATVPTGVHWRIKSVNALFETAAAAGNRVVGLTLQDNLGVTTAFLPPAAPSLPSTFNWLTWSPGNSLSSLTAAPTTVQSVGFPNDLILPGGWKLTSTTLGMNAADFYASVVLLVEEYIGQ